MFRTKFTKLLGGALLLGMGLAACDDSTGVDGDASMRVLLTDAPSDYVDSAWVDIGAVELIPAGDGGPVTLTADGTDGFVDLLDLQGTATQLLADADVPTGDYNQLRLIVDEARVALADGYEFQDGSTSKSLFVPSGAQTGIKLNLAGSGGEEESGPVTIAAGETVLVLDFDVNQSFVIQGDPEAEAGIRDMLFTPTISVVAENVAASVSGTVSTNLSDTSVEGLVVTAEPTGEGSLEEYQSQTGTAVTEEDGTYTIYFLVPGSYEVSVDAGEGLSADPTETAVDLDDGEDETGVDFELVESGS
ncbi:MAG: DUF4382 domain-containing protein [Gemmatimonadota bacterium]|nr:DUF4382 domain-containing protein [Gemmatimonadota bacterium]